MNTYTNPTTLVNFRIFPKTLEPFDHICFLQRKTRTQVLIELIDQYVLSVGSTVQDRLDETDLINDRLKTAVKRLKADRTRIDPASKANGAKKRLKRNLSSFDPASVDGGRTDAV